MSSRVVIVGTAVVVLVLAGVAAAAVVERRPTFANPVFEPILADPSVIRSGGWFYAYGTEDDWGDGEGRRQIPIARSHDLVEWEYVGEAFEDRPRWKAGYLWAPEIVGWGDRYHLYYSVSVWGDANPGIGVATAEHPAGPFTDHGPLFDSDSIGVANSIDPHVATDRDGTAHLIWGSFNGIYAVELTGDGLAVTGAPVELAGTAFEAPFIVERDGAYWFFGSLGSCCEGVDSTYRVAVGRSEHLLGPYVDRDGVDLRDGEGTTILEGGERFVGPGHNAVVTDDAGTDWIVYHAIDAERPRADSGVTRRPMLIDAISWDDDGWPTVAGAAPGTTGLRAPRIDPDTSS